MILNKIDKACTDCDVCRQEETLNNLASRTEEAEIERDLATKVVENIEGKVAMYSGRWEMEIRARKKAEALNQWFADFLSHEWRGDFLLPEEWLDKAKKNLK